MTVCTIVNNAHTRVHDDLVISPTIQHPHLIISVIFSPWYQSPGFLLNDKNYKY